MADGVSARTLHAYYFVFCAACFVLFLIERTVHSVLTLLWLAFRGRSSFSFRTLASLNVILGVLQWAWNVFISLAFVGASFGGGVLSSARVLVVFVAVGLALTYVYEFQGGLFLEMRENWNDGTGELVRALVGLPLELMVDLVKVLLPLYNVATWISSQTVRVFIFGVRADLSSFLNALIALANTVRALALSFVAYAGTLQSCPLENNLTDTSCFEPGLRQFDLVTPLSHFGDGVGFALQFVSNNCGPLAGLLNVVLYPLMDVNFIRGTHYIFNAAVFPVFQLPVVTWERAKYAEGRGFERIMRMPDVNPVFEFFVQGARLVGRGLDNWLDIAAATLRGVFTGRTPTCPPSVTDSDLPGTDNAVFGNNETTIVALTPGLYAITDGWSVEYVSHYRSVERHVALGAWPLAVDVRFGIAAVRYNAFDEGDASGSGSTTAMLGCRCDDVEDATTVMKTRMIVMCAVLPYLEEHGQNVLDYVVPVLFQVQATAGLAKCAMMTFSVQSVRFPMTRVAVPDVTGVSAALSNRVNAFSASALGDAEDPAVADAALWVIPNCDVSGDGLSNYVCTPGYVDSGCYPFCMAARVAASANAALVLYDADDWDEMVQLLQRYCDSGATIFTTERPPEAGFTAEVRFPDGTLGGAAYSNSSEAVGTCEYQREAVSLVSKQRLATYAKALSEYTSVRLEDQPYVVAGDAALFIDYAKSELYVKRLFAADAWQYTVETLPRRIPVNTACNPSSTTAAQCSAARFHARWDPQKITVEPAFSSAPGLSTAAVASRWSVFFAVNPDAGVYSEFYRWCYLLEQGASGTTGFQISNAGAYNAPRVWRVDAFAEDLGLVDDSATRSAPQSVSFKSFTGDMRRSQCSQMVNMSIVSLAYINERNVAITVLAASPAYFNPVTNRLYAEANSVANTSQVTHTVYYLDPLSMQMRTQRLWEDAQRGPTMADGVLCPELRTMPAFGTVLAEAAVAAAEAVRMPMNALFSLPVLLELETLAAVRSCPVVTRGHSLLRECGVYMFSLDRFFEALIRSNAQLWRTLSYVSRALNDVPKADGLRPILNGANVFFAQTRNVISSAMRQRAVRVFQSLSSGVLGGGGGGGGDDLEGSAKGGVAAFSPMLLMRNSLSTARGKIAEWIGSKATEGTGNVVAKLPATMTKLGASMAGVATQISDVSSRVGSLITSRIGGPLRWAFSGVSSGIGFSWWVYDNVVQLALELLGDRGPKGPLSKFWSRLYDARVSYRVRVTHEMEKACAGARLLFGGTGAVAESVQAACFLQVYFADGILEALSVLTVDYVMMDCMCGAPAGSDFAAYVTDVCLVVAPREYEPVVRTALDLGLASGVPKDMCVAVTNGANERLLHAFDLFFAAFYDLAQGLGGVVSQLLAWMATHAGQCTDFYTNPYLVTLMPTPVGYWKVCGSTQSCAYKCGDLLDAFDEAREFSSGNGIKTVEFATVVEKPFVSDADILNGRVNAPFQVLALVEHGDCAEVCGSDMDVPADGYVRNARCFSVVGVNKLELLEVRGYCVPGLLGVSLWKAFEWTVSRSDEWTADLIDVYFAGSYARKHKLSGRMDIPLVVLRRDGIYLYARDGFVRQLVRSMQDEVYTEQDFATMHVISEVTVVPGSLPGGVNSPLETRAVVLVSGSVYTDVGVGAERETLRCNMYTFFAGALTYNSAITSKSCAAEDGDIGLFRLQTLTAGETRVPVFLDADMAQVLFVPIRDRVPMALCTFNGGSATVTDCVMGDASAKAMTDANLAQASKRYSGSAYTETGVQVRRSDAVSTTCMLSVSDERGGTYSEITQYMIFATAFSNSEAWIAELRMAVGTKDLKPLSIARFNSGMQGMNTQIARDCTVNTCSACVSIATQKICYAAQQCVVSRCIGTAVNFRTPSCAWGGMIQQILELYASTTVALWFAVYEVTALIVDSSTGVLDNQVYVDFPHQFINLVACELKDVIVTSVATVTSMVGTALFNGRQIADLIRFSPEVSNDFFAQTTLLLASITNLVAHVLYFPLYNMFAFVQAFACGVNDVLMIFDLFGKEIRIGSPDTLEAFGEAAGECASMLVGDDMEEVAIDAEAQDGVSSIINDVMQAADSAYLSNKNWNREAQLARKAGGLLATGTAYTVRKGVSLAGKATVKGVGMLGKGVLKASLKVVRGVVTSVPVVNKGFYALESKAKLALTGAQGKAADTLSSLKQSIASGGKSQTGYIKLEDSVADKSKQRGADSRMKKVMTRSARDGKSAAKKLQAKSSKALGKLLGGSMMKIMMTPAKATMHWLDAMLVWGIGVVRAVQDVTQTADRRHCRLPDATIVDVPTCPCGDFVAGIPPLRQKEGVNEGAFWCSGTLDIVLSDGTSQIVYNPYTFAELKRFAVGMEAYLECIGSGNSGKVPGGCSEIEPSAPVLAEQGASLITVLTRCRSNYVNKQWDAGAALLFAPELSDDLVNYVDVILSTFDENRLPLSAVDCMYTVLESGGGQYNDACLDAFLRDSGLKDDAYFSYDVSGATSDEVSLVDIDACEVFTGPAATHPEFGKCIDTVAQGFSQDADNVQDCEFDYFLWAGRSTNKVPLASPHYKSYKADEERWTIARNMIVEVQKALEGWFDVVESWEASDLDLKMFSADGDGLHQAMDCMIMGPYAGADLWPGPPETLGSVRYSRTVKAEDFTQLSRQIKAPCGEDGDLDGDDAPPYTCGSATRKAVMKYFVREKLQGEASELKRIVQEVVREKVQEMREQWLSEDVVGCRKVTETAVDGTVTYGERSIQFCDSDYPEEWVSYLSAINSDTPVNGDNILDVIMRKMQEFVSNDLLLNTPKVVDKYYHTASMTENITWTEDEALIAASFSLFDPLQAIVTYGLGEENTPMHTSLWDMCTAHVSQFMSTFPMINVTEGDEGAPTGRWTLSTIFAAGEFDPLYEADYSRFAGSLETYMAQISERAVADSPLWWQYAMRFVPSDSGACASWASFAGERNFTFAEAVIDESDVPVPNVLLDIALSLGLQDVAPPVFRHHGFLSGPLGEMHAGGCACDWWHNKTSCVIPLSVCSSALAFEQTLPHVARVCHGAAVGTGFVYSPADGQVLLDLHNLLFYDTTAGSAAGNVLRCDSFALSDRWGVHRDATGWTNGSALRVRVVDMIAAGRSGVRLGNLHQHYREWHKTLFPARRLKPLVHPDERGRNATVAQRACETDVKKWAQERRQLVLDRYIDELFPVAQVVQTSAPLAYCTRFMLEVARLYVLQRVYDQGSGGFEIEVQQQAIKTWRERCRHQLGVVAHCNLRGVYQVIPAEKQKDGACPFQVVPPFDSAAWYVTSNCLVYQGSADRFYDPCRCLECRGFSASTYTLSEIRACELPTDVRRLLRVNTEFNAGLHWARLWTHLDSDEATAVAEAVNRVLQEEFASDVPRSLNGNLFFTHTVRSEPARDFNAADDWRFDEGVLNANFCDAVFDWWPGDDFSWTEPVGYQVTVPPFSDEAGYAGFDSGFVVQRGSNDSFVHIVYEHSMARNTTLSENYYGASGYCGLHSYAMPMMEMNTMRVCTRTSRATHADPTVPIRASLGRENLGSPSENSQDATSQASSVFPDACSTYPGAPWEASASIYVHQGTGLLNFWEDGLGLQDFWPPLDGSAGIKYALPLVSGYESDVGLGQSGECPFTELYVCQTDADCRDSRILLPGLSPSTLVCMRRWDSGGAVGDGVCAVAGQNGIVFECVNHGKCSGDQMCAGDGQCVDPVVSVWNDLSVPVLAQVFTEDCSSQADARRLQSQDMWGASRFEAVPDMLEASGMCSYRSWFEYRELLNEQESSLEGAQCSQSESVCTVNGKGVGRKYTAGSKERSTDSLWEAGLLKVQPSACDRDYMHLQDTTACFPGRSIVSSFDGVVPQYHAAPAGAVLQTYTAESQLPLFWDTSFRQSSFAFASIVEPLDELLVDDISPFRICSDIEQCHLDTHSVVGHVVPERLTFGVLAAAVLSGDIDSSAGNNDGFNNGFIAQPVNNVNVMDRFVARPIAFNDVFVCGAFGLNVASAPGLYRHERDQLLSRGECVLDPAVAQLFFAVCHADSTMPGFEAFVIGQECADWFSFADPALYSQAICQHKFSGQQVATLPFYPRSLVTEVRDHLNKLYTDFFRTDAKTVREYVACLVCVNVVHVTLLELVDKFAPKYSIQGSLSGPRWLYFYDTYALTEFPMAWWVKCTLLSGIPPRSGGIVDCPAWEFRFNNIGESLNTARLSVLEVLRRFDGGITQSVLDEAFSDSYYSASDTCAGAGPQSARGLQGYLYSLFRKIAADLQVDPAFVACTRRDCAYEQRFNTEYAKSSDWINSLYERFMVGDFSDLPEEYVYSLDRRPELWPSSTLNVKVWDYICEYFFGGDTQRNWFETMLDENLDLFKWDTERGVPVAKFLFPLDVQGTLAFQEAALKMETLYNPNNCNMNAVVLGSAAEEHFCVFRERPDLDPLMNPFLGRLRSGPDKHNTNIMFLWRFGDFDLAPMTLDNAWQFMDALIPNPQDGLPATGSGDVNGFDLSYHDICYAGASPSGKICSFADNGPRDFCNERWVNWYTNELGFAVQCYSRDTQTIVQDVQNNFVNPPDDLLEYIKNKGSNGMCWGKQQACQSRSLDQMTQLYVPEGVYFRGLFASGQSYPPAGSDMPYWAQCPVIPGTDFTDQDMTGYQVIRKSALKTSDTTMPGGAQTVTIAGYILPSSNVIKYLNVPLLFSKSKVYYPEQDEVITFDSNKPAAISFHLHKEYRCCTGGVAACAGVCDAESSLVLPVKRNMYRCVPCTRVPKVHCRGPHNCLFSRYVPVLNSLDANYLLKNNFNTDEPLTTERYTYLTRLLLARRFEALESKTMFHIQPATTVVPVFDEAFLGLFKKFSSLPAETYTKSLSGGVDETGKKRGIQECASAETNGLAVQYSKCSNDFFLEQFRDFVDRSYRKQAFVSVAPAQLVSWLTSKAQVTSETVYAYAEEISASQDRFASWVLDLEQRCLDADMYSSVCKLNPVLQRPELFNPWAGGSFNAVEMCDTPQDSDYGGIRFDVGCNRLVCPNYIQGNYRYDPFFAGVPDTCIERNGQVPTTRLPPRAASNNLCAKAPVNLEVCKYKQSVVGGKLTLSGRTSDGVSVASLYSRVAGGSRVGRGGIFKSAGRARNLLFAGFSLRQSSFTDVAAMRVAIEDIGGHYLGFRVLADGSMLLDSMILGSVKPAEALYLAKVHMLHRSGATDSLSWLSNLEGLFVNEHASVSIPSDSETADSGTTTVSQPSMHWACPFRRLRYWSGVSSEASQRPTQPDVRRMQKLFSPVTENLRVHPVMPINTSHWPSVQYYTANGYCLCTKPEDCSQVRSATGQCSLVDSVRALYDQQWRQAVDLSAACTEQLDWPYMGGSLRDGSQLYSTPPSQCSVFDRLPKFSVRQTNAQAYSETYAGSTLEDGGDCHMGRLGHDATKQAAEAGFTASLCRLHDKNASHMTLLCGGSGYLLTVAREASALPLDVVQALKSRRRKCKDASAPPTFKDREGKTLKNVSSFGLPFRVSSERFVAGELARVICNHINCSSEINVGAWTPHKFLETLLKSPSELFSKNMAQGSQARGAKEIFTAAPVPLNDSVLWETPWVACKVGREGNMTCRGTIDRAKWLDPRQRLGQCLEALQRENDNDLVMDLEICNLDSTFDMFCQQLATARKTIRTAHCVAAGDCFNKYFFYNPGTYSITNDEFVYNSVRDFYRRKDPTSCDVSASLQEIIEQNNELRMQCGSTYLQPLVVMMEYMRSVMQKVVRMGFYVVMILFKFVELFPTMAVTAGMNGGSMDTNRVNRIFGEILMYLKLILKEFVDLMNSVGDFFYDIITESPWGKKLVEIIYELCSAVNRIWGFIQDVVCAAITSLKTFFQSAEEGFDSFCDTRILGGQPLQPLKKLNFFRGWAKNLGDSMRCSEKDSLACDKISYPETVGDGALPAATRCWTQYISSFGDENVLSCRPSDTCTAEDGSRVVCDACPLQPAGINDFACDPITKMCKCGVPSNERTPCTQHQQCTQDSRSTCVFLDSDLQNTFGNVPCSTCTTRAMCVLSSGGEYGVCSCPLQNIPYASCSEDLVGDSVYIDSTSLCLTMLGAARQRADGYAIDYPRSAAIPCSLVESSASFCFRVWLSPTIAVYHIVALEYFEPLGGGSSPYGRRLLGTAGPVSGLAWNDTSGLCTRLMQLRSDKGEQAMAVSDFMAMQSCVKWRSVAITLISRHNLSRVDDHFLLSSSDFANTVARLPALAELVSHPVVLYEALLHTSYAEPIRRGLAACSRWVAAYISDIDASGQPANNSLASAVMMLLGVLGSGDIEYNRGWDVLAGDVQRALHNAYATNLSEALAVRMRNEERYIQAVQAIMHFSDSPVTHMMMPAGELNKVRARRQLLEAAVASAIEGAINTTVRTLLAFEPSVVLSEHSDPVFDLESWQGKDCPIGSELLQVFAVGFRVIAKEYSGNKPAVGKPAKDLVSSLPKVERKFALNSTMVMVGPDKPRPGSPDADPGVKVLYLIREQLEKLWDMRAASYDVMATAPDTLQRLTRCDLEKVVFCTEYRRTVVHASVQVLIMNYLLQQIAVVIRLPFVGRLLFWITPLLVMFYALDYSPFCVPIIPPCILDELVWLVRYLLPEQVGFPNSLQVYPGCIDGAAPPASWGGDPIVNGPRNVSCLVSCFDSPHSFTSTEVPLAWWLCDLHVDTCRDFADWLVRRFGPVTWARDAVLRIQGAVYQKITLIELADADLVSAQRFCATMTTWFALPWIALLAALLYMLTWGVALPFVIMHGVFRVFIDCVVSMHASAGTARDQLRNVYVQHDLRRSLRDGGRFLRRRLFRFWG